MRTLLFSLGARCALAAAALLPFRPAAEAQTTVVVSSPGRKFPIALPQLCLEAGQTTAPTEVPRVISRDLDLSGFFDVLNPGSYVETPGRCVPPDAPEYADWSIIRAEWLVRGTVSGQGPNLTIRMFLHDVPGQRAVLGKEYQGSVAEIPRIAHKFANEIMKYVTGEYGPFGSQIVFSGRVGRFKDLFLMDMDGSNVRQLTNDRGLALSPDWSPDGSTLLYTAYRDRVPDLFLMDVATGRSRQLTRGPALEVGGAFTKDGRSLVTSVSKDRESSLVLLDLNGTQIRSLTPPNRAIDVSPSFSPDGSEVAFCSDRAGRPQIYVMGADGSNARRISFVSSEYCTSPAWSPKGDRIAFVCRADGGFQLFVANPDGSNPVQLTSGGDNEDPSWSPDGRYLVFASTFGKRSGFDLALIRVIKNLEGTNMKALTTTRGDDMEPSWGPLPR